MASTSGDWGSLVTLDQPIVGDPGSCTLLGRAGTRLPLLKRAGRGLSPPWTVGRASPRGGPTLPTATVTRGSPQVPESLGPICRSCPGRRNCLCGRGIGFDRGGRWRGSPTLSTANSVTLWSGERYAGTGSVADRRPRPPTAAVAAAGHRLCRRRAPVMRRRPAPTRPAHTTAGAAHRTGRAPPHAGPASPGRRPGPQQLETAATSASRE